MKVVVAGASGFIGKRLKAKMEKSGVDGVYLTRKKEGKKVPEGFLAVDYSNMQQIKEAFTGADVVIDLIGRMDAEGVQNEYEKYYEVNCKMTMRLLQASEECGVKQFIYCSTPGVQGFGKRLCKEEEAYAPRNSYEKTKVEAEKQIIAYVSNHDRGCSTRNTNVNDGEQDSHIPTRGGGICYTIIRPDFVYGPGDSRRVKLYRSIKNKKFILTTSGNSYLHPTYVDDVVQGFLLSIRNKNAYNQIFNISAENDVTAKVFLQTIAHATGSKLIQINIGYPLSLFLAGMIEKIYRTVLKKEPFVSKNKIDFLALDHSTSIEKAKKILGYHPEYDIKRGMEKTIAALRSHH